jgi:ABC-type transporter lipoprotein component MlaA
MPVFTGFHTFGHTIGESTEGKGSLLLLPVYDPTFVRSSEPHTRGIGKYAFFTGFHTL